MEAFTQNNLTKDAIFNADETGLFWKNLPDKTYVHSAEKTASGRKISRKEGWSFYAAMRVVEKDLSL